MKNSIKIALFIVAMALFVPLYAQQETSLEFLKEQICKKWNYSKCRILGIEYTSNKDEAGDMIQFERDMTYTLIEQGKVKEGKWSYSFEKNRILLLDQNEQVVKELTVDKLTDSEFIYTITMNRQYEVSMFMKSEALN
ncbi:MAG: hypothetical protein ACPGJS_11530 [Flammeovirgaceae bacterium]